MIPVLCFVHEGQLSPDDTARLDADLDAFTRAAFDDEAAVRRIVVPAGGGFTAAAPSTAFVVSVLSDRPLASAERTRLLCDLSERCAAVTGKAPGELVLSLLDPDS